MKTPRTKRFRLTGKALANVYAAYLTAKLGQKPGAVWAHYEGGGWIVTRGEGLEPHPDMRATYPNGWSLFDRKRAGQVRAALAAAVS